MTLESNTITMLFVSHTDLTFNEEDNVIVSDNSGCSSKAIYLIMMLKRKLKMVVILKLNHLVKG